MTRCMLAFKVFNMSFYVILCQLFVWSYCITLKRILSGESLKSVSQCGLYSRQQVNNYCRRSDNETIEKVDFLNFLNCLLPFFQLLWLENWNFVNSIQIILPLRKAVISYELNCVTFKLQKSILNFYRILKR